MFEAPVDGGLANGADAAGRAADNIPPRVRAAVNAIEARCFKAVTPVVSHVPFIRKRQHGNKVPLRLTGESRDTRGDRRRSL